MYRHILAALDGSHWSNLAIEAALSLAGASPGCELTGCHVYAAELHRQRFQDMETGLPDRYQEEQRLAGLRGTHESLITDGLKLISDAYLAPLARAAQEKAIACRGLTPEGRNYAVLLDMVHAHRPDLLVMGAYGHGHVPEGVLGSMTERLLLYAPENDLLIMRRAWRFKNQPILAAVDGSRDSYAALQRALELGRALGAAVEMVAVYDPFFHLGVFGAIAAALPQEDQERFNFSAQEKIHDEIIDRGLETLYREGLERGALLAKEMGMEARGEVLAGKVFSQVNHYASVRNAGLLVVGRWGLHREACSLAGSSTLALARLAQTNLLVTAPPGGDFQPPQAAREEGEEAEALTWTPEAEQRLERVPAFARRMARKAIEERARKQGLRVITPDFVLAARQK